MGKCVITPLPHYPMIKIVTDSAMDVPPDIVEKYGITVIPVYVNIGEKGYLEGVELSRQEFYDNLEKYEPYPTTAAPSPGTFAEVYERLTREGATEILSIHLASALSATCDNARIGAEAAENTCPVHIFDSQQITLGGGLLVLTAVESLAAGKSLPDILQILNERVPRTRVFGMIDTMESLRRGGRVSWAQFGIGTLLQIKPVMMISAGEINVIAKVRTRKKALPEMLRLVEEFGPFERIAILHVRAPEAAVELQQQSVHLFPAGETPLIAEVTPAIGAHLGLGAVGFAAIAAR
ncbi:MAG TPA: DegV family protein [Chloroflexota bacterium]|nr:DegV family protein [Chloroflexota bacterium]HUM69233.1 DegV family protein [Chloroflexota bacterium]